MSDTKPVNVPIRTVWCKHFRSMGMHDTCELGIKYADVRKDHEPIAYQNNGRGTVYTSVRSLPCIATSNLGGATCDKCELPTAEEQEADEREIRELMGRTVKARAAIVASLGGPWRRGMKGSAGEIDCPVCGAAKSLRFTRSGYNGHIHAACKTDNCVSWME
jgi:hypothetical protein